MKKLIATAVVTTMLLATGAAFGQSASHEVEVRIPNVLMLRITDGVGNAEATAPSVSFDFQADFDTYLDAVNSGVVTDLFPTDVNDFGDVIVFSNRGTWNVTVATTGITFANDLNLVGVTGNGVALTDITVAPPAAALHGSIQARAASWNLAGGQIANGVRTQGWRSLGFSGNDYRLAVNGDEDPGTYTTTVTYTIAAP